MADSASDARLRACGRAVMLSNHVMGDVAGDYSDVEKGAISRMPGAELAFRDSNRGRRLPERASFPVPRTFEGYDWSAVRLPPRLSREDVTTCAFVRKARNLVLFGPVGTGKTHMLVAMGTVARSMGMRVRYFTTTEPVTLLSEAKRDGTARKLMRSPEGTDLILLDGFGYVPVDRDGAPPLPGDRRELREAVAGHNDQRGLLQVGSGADRRPDGGCDHRPGRAPRAARRLRGRELRAPTRTDAVVVAES